MENYTIFEIVHTRLLSAFFGILRIVSQHPMDLHLPCGSGRCKRTIRALDEMVFALSMYTQLLRVLVMFEANVACPKDINMTGKR